MEQSVARNSFDPDRPPGDARCLPRAPIRDRDAIASTQPTLSTPWMRCAVCSVAWMEREKFVQP
jgi:hypothetical protein